MCEEGEGELQAGVEKQVQEVGPTNRSQTNHVGLIDVFKRRKLKTITTVLSDAD